MKKYTIAVLGCGTRGQTYAKLLLAKKDQFEAGALCDPNPEQMKNLKSLSNIESVPEFTDPAEFLKEKRADVLIIATPDRDHIPQAVKGLELGYDIILEKPLTDSREELELLVNTQKKTGKKIIVCHELRYAPGFAKCYELLQNGAVGKLSAIDASERVSYVHWVQAYVRGIGGLLATSHPCILAKCSHDLDLTQWYAGSPCDTLTSVGDLHFFKEENAPEGATDRCLDCPHKDTCIYSAKKLYLDKWHNEGEPEFAYPFNKVTVEIPHTEERIVKGLREGEYGRCAFKCHTDKVDRQMVQMTFENGVKASLKMIFSARAGRYIVFYGTHGEIIFDERKNTISVMRYGQEEEIIDVFELIKVAGTHSGGDTMFMNSIYGTLEGTEEPLTPLSASIECHLMGIAAEESRKEGGALVKVHR